MKPIRIATRGSELALWQAKFIAERLGRESELVVLSTRGDRDQASSLSEIGGQGIFVKEIQAALLDGRADMAVHSAKDLPTQAVDGLVVGAYPRRGDPRDALIGKSLDQLKPGDLVATGSIRRQVQLKAIRPDLDFVALRGNMATRFAMVERVGAVLVAYAALERLGRIDLAVQVFDPTQIIPQVGQGALAVECRSGADDLRSLLTGLDDLATRLAVESERNLLRQLGSGCALPIGAYAVTRLSDSQIDLIAFVGSMDSMTEIRVSGSGGDPIALGSRLGRELLANGGAVLLAQTGAGEKHD